MTHLITSFGQPATMSSLEISELVEQRHDNVKRTIETLGRKGVVTLPQIAEVSNTGPGPKTISVYQLTKRDSLVVVAQLSPEFTARVIDRWQQLEAQPAMDPMQVLADPAAMRGLLLTYTEKVLALESQVGELTPKAGALDRIAIADGSLCLQDSAKQLQVRPKDLIAFMSAHQWIYKRAGGAAWIGYQDRIQSGLLEHKCNIVIDAGGNERIRDQVRVTAKGLARLAVEFQREAA